MLFRIIAALFAVTVLTISTAAAEGRRVALVIGQNAYPGGGAAKAGLPVLYNSRNDAARLSKLLGANGFDVISCDGKSPGCLDLDRKGMLAALSKLEASAKGADMALVFFAGHGLATDEGNILTPTDAKLDCATGAVTQGIPVERFMAATAPAKHKLMILDACRDNPIGDVCPGLKGKKLAFTRIEAGALQNFLLVTSTQFGQQALDGPKGQHSPFATALFQALEKNPAIYFEQVMNEVARATYEAAKKQDGFEQIPGKVVGGAAPADCLAGKGCVGDVRMAALAREMETLAAESAAAKADATGVRAIIANDEKARGKPYTPEERTKRVAELGAIMAGFGASGDPLRQEARRLIDAGQVPAGQAKLDEALDAEEKAAAEAERLVAEKKKAAARSARDLAVLSRGSNVGKAADYYKRATGLDPSDAQTWDDYARAAVDAGRLGEAKTSFEQAAMKARENGNDRLRYWATLGLGDVAVEQGSLPSARRLYETAVAIVGPLAKSAEGKTDAGSLGWQRDLSVSYNKVGDVLVAQGNLPEALKAFRDSLAITEKLAKADPASFGLHGSAMTSGWQRDLSVSQEKIGDVLVAQGNLPDALKAFKDSLAIADKLAKADPASFGLHGSAMTSVWQRDLSVSYIKVGDVLVAQGNLPDALKAFKDSLAIREKLTKADPGNAGWQRDVAISNERIGDIASKHGDTAQAKAAFERALGAYETLVARNPGDLP
ncbi:MAG: hypothetical protein CTY36_11050, partial [Methylocystis sp.]